MASTDYRLQLRCALSGLEQTHLAEQSFCAARHLIRETAHLHAAGFMHDILKALREATRTARKYRYRLAMVVVGTGAGMQPLPLLQQAAQQATACIALESQPADVEDLAALFKKIAAALVEHSAACQAAAGSEGLIAGVVVDLLMGAIIRAPSQETAASGHVLFAAALEGLADAPPRQSVPLSHILVAALQRQLQSMNSGSPRMQVPQAFAPVRQCLWGLGADAAPASVKACLKACLHGTRNKVSWLMRREALDTLAALGESMLTSDPESSAEEGVAAGALPLPLPGGLDALLDALPTMLAQLQDVRFDKIVHVRNSCAKALTALQQVAATNHRSDIAHMPLSRPGTGGDLQRPRSARRRLPEPPALRQPLRAVSNAPPTEPRLAAAKHASIAGVKPQGLDFGVQIFALPTPPPLSEQVQADSAEEAARPEDCGSSPAAATDIADMHSSGRAPQLTPSQPAGEQPAAGDRSQGGDPAVDAPQSGQHSSLAPAQHWPACAEQAAVDTRPEAGSESAMKAGNSHAVPASAAVASDVQAGGAGTDSTADLDVVAGPLRVQLRIDDAAIRIFPDDSCGPQDRLQGLQDLRVWNRGPADYGLEIVAASSRVGVSTVHRYSCSNGLLSRQVVDRASSAAAPDGNPLWREPHSVPADSGSGVAVLGSGSAAMSQPAAPAEQPSAVADSRPPPVQVAEPPQGPVAWEVPV